MTTVTTVDRPHQCVVTQEWNATVDPIGLGDDSAVSFCLASCTADCDAAVNMRVFARVRSRGDEQLMMDQIHRRLCAAVMRYEQRCSDNVFARIVLDVACETVLRLEASGRIAYCPDQGWVYVHEGSRVGRA
jgi:hypothetical protein